MEITGMRTPLQLVHQARAARASRHFHHGLPATRRRLISIVAAGVLAATLAGAGRAEAQVQALGYGIAGPAGYSAFFNSSSTALHAAGGAEVLAGGRVGVGGEFGLLLNLGGALWVTSANGVFHFTPSVPTPTRSRVSPFVTGGYTRMTSGDGAFNAWNIGGGADVWLKPRVGLRLEFRDHIRPDRRGNVQYWTFRAGVVFR
jgi:hypothetical protein